MTMKTIGYIIKGTYKTVKVENSVDSYDYIRKIENTTLFTIHRVVYE